MSLYLSFQNLTTVVGILIGSISSFFNNYEIDSGLGLNKYFLSSLTVAVICFVTLILNLVRFKFVIPSRRAIHYEVNMDNSNRKSSRFADNVYVSKVRKNSQSQNMPPVEVVNLDLFASNSSGFKDEKFHSKRDDSLPKENELGQLNKNDLQKHFIKLESDIIETDNVDRKHIQQGVQDESKLNISDKHTNRPIMNIMSTVKSKDIAIGTIDGNEKTRQIDGSRNPNDSIVLPGEHGSDRMGLTPKYGDGYNNIGPFKISLIFCTIQVSDILLYNILLLSLVLPKDLSGYELDIMGLSIYLILFHLVYSLVIPLSNGLLLSNSKTLSRILLNYRILYIIAFSVSLWFLANYKLEYPFKYIVQVVSLILKSITMMGMLTSYNLLVIKIPNNRFKDKLTGYQNFFALVVRAISGCLISFIFVYFNTQLTMILVGVAIFTVLILLLNYYLFKKLFELIK
jgi:hypothetical protein